ncbi:MAG: N-6 DNA methylase [Fibrobacter sp.]|nr:N-6 DNA methylase [Fibrobacter sp.]
MDIREYVNQVSKKYTSGISTEHTYRGYLQTLIESLVSKISVTNEPQRIKCGSPDYIITRKEIPVGYIEAKDVGADLDSKNYQEQFERYKNSLSNLIITDYLEFRFYRDGDLLNKVRIGEIKGKKITLIEERIDEFDTLIKDFCDSTGQTIKSSSKLSKIMAGKARLLAKVIETALSEDEGNRENNALRDQLEAFQQILIHDLKIKEFSDIYAQTITYGMFAARLHDDSMDTFSRIEAATLIPKTNPFLRKLFQYIAGYDLDDRIKWIVDDLADVFRATNVSDLLKDFGKATKQSDPIIHFYETFLSEYDPALRKSRGVWYTPEPVVNFIVRAVDDILKQEFGLKDGLADTSKTEIEVATQTFDKKKQAYKKEKVIVHKVQILDPATGTGTFLAEVIKHVYKNFEGQQGIWNQYVDKHLIPRLHGFEILMASYAMAHLKLDLLLGETGYKSNKDQRFKVYLTNSLEEHHPDTGTLFANWLSEEANEANHVKRDTPVMCVIGNPPYSVSSTNRGEWINKLLEDYKKDLKEKSYNSLSDDYVKFIRYGQYFIEKNGSGILAYISNNSFTDGIVFRKMRENLLNTFDKIYILNLHGNSKKKEVCPDGSPDQNVFDIMQGVSINLFVKTGKKKANELGNVLTCDLQAKREQKYNFVTKNSLGTIKWRSLKNKAPEYFFVIKNYIDEDGYKAGFIIDELFTVKAAGIKTHRDAIVIGFTTKELMVQLQQHEKNDYSYEKCKCITYRPFDERIIYYDTELVVRHRKEQIKHSFQDNFSLLAGRQTKTPLITHFFISRTISEMKTAESSTGSYHFPLYLYPDSDSSQSDMFSSGSSRVPNLNMDIVKQIGEGLSLTFTPEKEGNSKKKFAPIDILDYIYAVLHSPSYREKNKEFLKIDFPRVHYPKDKEIFWKLVKLGGELREIHILESPVVEKLITKYPKDGNNEVGKIEYKDLKVWINPDQYFENVPQVAWEFFIGGYQPAQKWLKDRKGRELSYEDIVHYQKIIVALVKTDEIMKKIDEVDFLN